MTVELKYAYLHASGIPAWIACIPLVGSAASAAWTQDFQYPDAEVLPNTKTVSKPVASVKSSSTAKTYISHTRADLDSLLATAINNESVAPEVSTTLPAVEDTPQFKLAFQRIGEILLIDSLPPQGSNFTPEYQKMALGISQALGITDKLAEPFLQPWPMFASKSIDQGRVHAIKTVQYKLDKELEKATKIVILLGEMAAQMVLNQPENLEQLKAITFNLRTGVTAIASHSLTEAMQLPDIKKQIWKDLQPLIASNNV